MSKVTLGVVAVGVIAVALTIGLRQGIIGYADRTTSREMPSSENAVTHPVARVADARPPATHRAAAEQTPILPTVEKEATRDSREPLRTEGSNPDDSSSSVQAATGRDTAAPTTAGATASTAMDPRNVIGRPFPVSASVISGCKSAGCPRVDEYLSQFAQEPRDLAWASDMEIALRNYVTASQPDVTIRNVECRTSVCFIEVASVGPFLKGISLDGPLHSRVLPATCAFGYERGRTTVTLQPFTRR
jgi:hypothetical protein